VSVYFSPISRGLGDLVISLPAVQALIAAGEGTHLVVRSPAQLGLAEYLLPELSGIIPEPDFLKAPLPEGARSINLRDHPLQRKYRWDTFEFKAEYPDYLIMDVAAHIAADKGIQADFKKLTPLPCRRDSDLSGTVLLVPGSSHAVKSWSSSNWLELSRRIRQKVAIIGEPEKSPPVADLIGLGLPHRPTATFTDLLSSLSSALAVVSVDTGPMHLAIHQSTPTVGLYLNNPFYLRREKNAFAVIAPPCTTPCFEKSMDEPLNEDIEWDAWAPLSNWQCDEPPAIRCMEQVSIESVFLKLQEAISQSTSLKKSGAAAAR
jgi:ADP-heptose:LPS heptosyltransferase